MLLMAMPHDLFDRLDAVNFSFRIPMFIARFFVEVPAEVENGATEDVSEGPVTRSRVAKQKAVAAATEDLNKVIVSALDVPCYILSAIVAVLYLKTKHWITNNIFGMAFSIQGIALLNLDTFATGAILLVR